jgi:aspartyl protease family protein
MAGGPGTPFRPLCPPRRVRHHQPGGLKEEPAGDSEPTRDLDAADAGAGRRLRYRYELKGVAVRLRDELLPTRARTLDGGSVAVRRAEDGHFWIDAIVDDRTIRFLVDTGASDVVLSRDDAVRLGIPFESLRFARVFSTANGLTRGAAIELRQIRLGSISFDHVSAWVNEGEMAHSLLGMRLLEQLSSVEIKNDTLSIKR